jgi:hypothetical protein
MRGSTQQVHETAVVLLMRITLAQRLERSCLFRYCDRQAFSRPIFVGPAKKGYCGSLRLHLTIL